MNNSTERFSSRVENYIRYRPSYPDAILKSLKTGCGLDATSVIADIGSGTGILSELFLTHGNTVYGVEPNAPMREAGERLLKDYPRFHSVAGTAEATTLPDAGVDFVSAGQAFHWFDRDKARTEFRRILKPGGSVILVWNERQTDSTPCLRDYETLLDNYATDYRQVNHTQIDAGVIQSFFGHDRFAQENLENRQDFDEEGLKGRLLSSSYAPEAGQPNYEAMLQELHTIFQAHATGGRVAFLYTTTLYYGQLS